MPPGAATRDSHGCGRGTYGEGRSCRAGWEAALCRQDLTQAPGSGSSQGTTFCPQLQEAASKGQEQDTERAGMEGLGMPWCHGSERKPSAEVGGMSGAEEKGGNKPHWAGSGRACSSPDAGRGSVPCSRYPSLHLLLRQLPPCRTNNPVAAPGTLVCPA